MVLQKHLWCTLLVVYSTAGAVLFLCQGLARQHAMNLAHDGPATHCSLSSCWSNAVFLAPGCNYRFCLYTQACWPSSSADGGAILRCSGRPGHAMQPKFKGCNDFHHANMSCIKVRERQCWELPQGPLQRWPVGVAHQQAHHLQ